MPKSDITEAVIKLVDILEEHQHPSFVVGWLQNLLCGLETDYELKLNAKQRRRLLNIVNRDIKYLTASELD